MKPLLDGMDAIQIRDVLSPDDCSEVLMAVRGLRFDWYDETRVWPPIARFGPALNDFNTQGRLRPAYWASVQQAEPKWNALPALANARAAALARLSDVLELPLRPATIDGREVYHGTIREMPDGTLVHFDDVSKEFSEHLFDQRVLQQLAFVVYLSAPSSGGETVIWERGPVHADEECRVGYGYQDVIVTGLASLTFRPASGDGLLFRSSRLHAVTKASGGRRVSMHFFIGLTVNSTVIVWA